MALILNIRGTNGSGKTTLARAFIPYRPSMVNLVWFPSPTKKDPQRRGLVEGYGNLVENSIVVGSYRTACGGLDTISSFDRSFNAIRRAAKLVNSNRESNPNLCNRASVIAEGILASTVYGSWAEFAADMNEDGHQFAFCYLTTPLEVCLQRIKQRQVEAGKVREIKEDLVADKFKAIAATREKALRDGFLVYDLPVSDTEVALRAIINGLGDLYRAA